MTRHSSENTTSQSSERANSADGAQRISPPLPQPTWQRQLADAIRSKADLFAALQLSTATDHDFSDDSAAYASNRFPLLVPESFVRRMRPGDRADPLLLQVLPTSAELVPAEGFVADPVGDAGAVRLPGLLHKYHGRALLIASGACAVHCRYCFRREFPYHDAPRQLQDWQPALDLIADDVSVSEVILSGGDPLMLNDDRLGWLLQQLDAIDHIERIRLHSRLPIVLPARITDGLLQKLTGLRSQAILVVHANHGHEIEADCRDVLRSVVRRGIPVLNQAVLLKEINDNADVMEQLCRRLINIGVMPYYLHQLDRVQGAAHFEVSDAIGVQIVEELAKRLPGYAVPKLVREIPGAAGKTLVVPTDR